jgi:hypothetical protein
MNGAATFGDEWAALFCGAQSGGARRFGVRRSHDERDGGIRSGVGATSLICYWLMTRLQNRRRNRPSSGGSFEAGGGDYARGNGWSLLNRFSGDHSATDCSGNSADSAGGDREVAMAVVEATNAARPQ